MRRALIVFAALLLSACNLDVGNPDSEPGTPSDPATETFNPSLKIDISTMSKTPSGAYYRDATVGNGATVTSSPFVVMSYLGMLKTGALFSTGSQETIFVSNMV